MKESLLSILRCPACGASDWALDVALANDVETLSAQLRCESCKRDYPVSNGAVDLVPDEMLTDIQRKDREICARSDRQIAAQKGLGTFLGAERLREDEYRLVTAGRTEFLFSELEYDRPEERWVLDLGCGEPVLANRFAALGFNVVALDFVPTRLDSAHEMFASAGTFFERIAGLMARLPLMDGSLDIVFSHASLHHATPLEAKDFKWCDPANMLDTLAEVKRVLKPDGLFLVSGEGEYDEDISEEDRELEHKAEETGCYEAFYKRSEYEWAFRKVDLWPDLWAQCFGGRLQIATFAGGRHREIVTLGDSVTLRSGRLLRAPAIKRDLDENLRGRARVRSWSAGDVLPREGAVVPAERYGGGEEGWQPIEHDKDGDFRWLGRDPGTFAFELDFAPGDWRLHVSLRAFSMLGEFDAAAFLERDGRVVAREVIPHAADPADRRQELRIPSLPSTEGAGLRCISDGQMKLHVYLNGDYLTTFKPPADNEFHRFKVFLPARTVRRLNQLTFEPAYALRPCDCENTDDDRWLSCAVRDLRISRVESDREFPADSP